MLRLCSVMLILVLFIWFFMCLVWISGGFLSCMVNRFCFGCGS